jgi:hypothetical protein
LFFVLILTLGAPLQNIIKILPKAVVNGAGIFQPHDADVPK